MDCCFLSPSPWCDVPVQMFFFLFLIDVDANIFLSSICNWPMMIQLWVNIFNGLVVCLLFHRHGQYLVQRHFDAIASRWRPVVDPYYEITERYCSLALVSHLAWRRTLMTVLWQSWKKRTLLSITKECRMLWKFMHTCENQVWFAERRPHYLERVAQKWSAAGRRPNTAARVCDVT